MILCFRHRCQHSETVSALRAQGRRQNDLITEQARTISALRIQLAGAQRGLFGDPIPFRSHPGAAALEETTR